jgi:hypothetical protein
MDVRIFASTTIYDCRLNYRHQKPPMSFISKLKSMFAGKPASAAAPAMDPSLFIYIVLPANIGPMDRGAMFEDPLEPLLAAGGLGEISGGGCSLGAPGPDGTREVVFAGIDIDVTDRDMARELLRRELPGLGAPLSTTLQFTRDGVKLEDKLTEQGWSLDQPRTALHPGFGV